MFVLTMGRNEKNASQQCLSLLSRLEQRHGAWSCSSQLATQGVTKYVMLKPLCLEPKNWYLKPIHLYRQSQNFSSSEMLSLNRGKEGRKKERRKRRTSLVPSFFTFKNEAFMFSLLMSRRKHKHGNTNIIKPLLGGLKCSEFTKAGVLTPVSV